MHKIIKSIFAISVMSAVMFNSVSTAFSSSVLTQQEAEASLTFSQMEHIYEPGIENTSEELKCKASTQFTITVTEELNVTVPIYVTLALTEKDDASGLQVVAPTGYGFKNTGNVDAYINKAVCTRISNSFSMVEKDSDLYLDPNTFVMAFENGNGYSQDLDYSAEGFIADTDEWKIPYGKEGYVVLNPYDLGENTTLTEELLDGIEIFNVTYTVSTTDDANRDNITFPESY